MQFQAQGWMNRSYETFDFCGFRFPLYSHFHNCGHPTGVMSERAIELSLAQVFLDTVPRDATVEIGAVTPYYWPYRVAEICDPVDEHPRVNIRASYIDVCFRHKAILSLSTFEHIGQSDYGLPEDSALNRRAFEKLFAESDRFLITVPGGYNKAMDDYLLGLDCSSLNISIRHLLRIEGNKWIEKANPTRSELRFHFGALSLMVISRATFLEQGIPQNGSRLASVTR